MSKTKKKKRPVTTVKKRVKKPVILHIQESMSSRQKLLVAGILAILAMAIYAPSYDYGFVYDDDAVLVDNRYVKEGLGGLEKIWTTSYFEGYDEDIIARAFRPVPLTTLALEYEIWGLNNTVHHLFNLLFYGLTAFFLFLLMAKLLRDHHPFLPIAICLLFIFHPIHLEVVANIKSRDTMLGFLNLCVATWLLLKHLDTRKILPLALSIVFYSIALFSKEEIITSLATIPLMLWFFRDYKVGKIAKTMLPYFGAVVIYLVIRSGIVGGLNEGVTLTELDNSLLAANTIDQRIASNILVLGKYLWMTIFPHPLLSDYSYLTLPLVNWDDWRVYVALIANLALLGLGLHGLVKRNPHGFGPLFYFAAVSIFTSIIITNVSAYNDRFLYVAVLGICFLPAWYLTKLVKAPDPAANVTPIQSFFRHNFIPVAILAIVCSLGVLKIESHLPVWKDRYALFQHDVTLAPNNVRMRKNHGGSLARLALQHQSDRPDLMRKYAGEAIVQLDAALSVYPALPTGHIHKGNMYILLKQYDQAIAALNMALRYDPNNYFARTSLGNVYFRMGRYQDAINILESIDPRFRSENDKNLIQRCYNSLQSGGG